MYNGTITVGSLVKPKKITKKKLVQLKSDHVEHNKWLASFGQPKITLEQFIAQVYGLNKVSTEFRPRTEKVSQISQAAEKHREQYPSLKLDIINSNCDRRESPKYTGTLIKGISTMHKSNAVPVLSKDEMISHASMRR